MIQPHKHFTHPPETVTLWRFMDLARFLSLVSTSKLYFARSDCMEDTYESAVPRKVIEGLREKGKELTESMTEKQREKLGDVGGMFTNKLFGALKEMRQKAYLSCWYMDEYESAAMWSLYCGKGDGIAIRTDFTRLRDSLASSPDPVFAGVVNYIDYERDGFQEGEKFTVLSTVMHKRKSFQHEREMRLVWHSNPAIEAVGKNIDVDVPTLIAKVMIAPTARKWFKDVVADSLKAFGYAAIPLEQSSLYDQPVY